jgi:hypothetical protein
MTFLHSEYNSKVKLSAKELLEISQEISRNFTPCFSSLMPELELAEKIRFSSKELLDIGEEIGRDYAPKLSSNTPELMILPVDPGHLYAYWNLGKDSTHDNHGRGQLILRIYSKSDEQQLDTETMSSFDIAIDSPKTQQQVSLPDPVDRTAYSAAIGKCGADHSFIAVAHSEIIHVPRGRTQWRQGGNENSSHCLSKNASGLGISKQA